MTESQETGGLIVRMLRMLVGDVPMQWLRLIILGGAMVLGAVYIRDFKMEIVRKVDAAIASNAVWQQASIEERQRLVKKANTRLKRLYEYNGWVYEDLDP